jgi:putative acetyltransferase
VTSVRRARDSDAPAIRAVTTRAFDGNGDHGEHVADLVDALAAGPARVSLVAELDGEVVGHVLLSRAWIDVERELVEALVLSPLSVDPPVQHTGIGTGLVGAALAASEADAVPAVFLEGSWDYYSRFGFVAGDSRGFTRPSARIPGPAFQVVVLPAWQQWMTGAVVYPDAFWQADLVGLRGARLAEARAAVGETGH